MDQRSRLLVLSLPVIALLVVGLIFFHYIPDDTFIGLRYARHLLEGKGLVFNEGVRLEGYTNFLWLMIIAVAGRLGVPLVMSARVLGFLLSVATLYLAGYAAWTIYPHERGTWNHALAAALPPLVLAASAPFLTWSLSGTEIPLFTFLLLAGFILLRNGKRVEAVFGVLGLLGLVRPEGIIFYALAGGVLLLRRHNRRAVLLRGIGILALLYGPYLAWKIHYFGSVLPNTFHAKTGPFDIMIQNGFQYISGFALRYGYLLVIGLFLNSMALKSRERVLIPTAFVAVHWIALLLLGGDWMPHYRLLVPTMPIMLLVVSSGLGDIETVTAGTAERSPAVGAAERVPTDGNTEWEPATGIAEREPTVVTTKRAPTGDSEKWRNPAPVVVLLLVFIAMVPGGIGYRTFLAERVSVQAFARLGRYFQRTLPPGTSIGCGSTGAIGYYSDMRIIDILGLTEAHIAREGEIVARQPGHMKTDGRYVLDQEPDLLLLGNVQIHRGTRSRSEMRHKVQEQSIVFLPRFLTDYEFVNIPLTDGFYLSCYKRKDYFLPLE
jgi:arabinofuranosyltransferase